MKKGHVVGGALVVLAIVAALFLLPRDRYTSAPARPGAAAPAAPEEPAAPEPPPEPPAPEAPAAAPAPAETVEVVTNVPGAAVTVSFVTAGGAPELTPVSATADADGRVVLAVPEHENPIRDTKATARADGYIPATVRVRDGKARIVLKPGVRITGRVVDEAGKPVAEARVWCRDGSSTESVTDGGFEVLAPAEDEVRLGVRHPGYRSSETPIELPADEVVLVLKRGAIVSGRVTFPNGRSVVGARLQGPDRTFAVSDEDGRYVLTGLPDGELEVYCVEAGLSRTANAGATDVDFIVRPHVVRVTFLDEEGRPFRQGSCSARVVRDGRTIMDRIARIGDDGIFECEAPGGSTLYFAPSAPGYEKTLGRIDLEGEPCRHDIEFRLKRPGETGRVALRVTRDTGGHPGKVYLRVVGEADAAVGSFSLLEPGLDAEGRAEIELPPGRTELRVSARDALFPAEGEYGLTAKITLLIEAGRTVPAEVVLESGGLLRVTIHDTSGELLVPRDLELLSEGSERLLVFFRGKDARDGGSWWLPPRDPGPAYADDPLPPGNYIVVFRRDGKEAARREIAIERGRTLTVDLRLEK